MKLYEIDSRLEDLYENAIDPETGEINPEVYEEIDSLNMERAYKVENLGLWYKNTMSDVTALDAEISNLTKRRDTLKRKAEWQKQYLFYVLHGEKFESPKVAISYRRSESVEFDNVDLFCERNADDDMIVTTTVTRKPNRVTLKRYLKDGWTIHGCHLEEHQNIQIK